MAEDRDDAAARVTGHRIVGSALYHLGRLVESRTHLEEGLALYDPERDRGSALVYALDSSVVCSFWLVHVLFAQGYPDQARARMREALAYARELAHPYTLAVRPERRLHPPRAPPAGTGRPDGGRDADRPRDGAGLPAPGRGGHGGRRMGADRTRDRPTRGSR